MHCKYADFVHFTLKNRDMQNVTKINRQYTVQSCLAEHSLWQLVHCSHSPFWYKGNWHTAITLCQGGRYTAFTPTFSTWKKLCMLASLPSGVMKASTVSLPMPWNPLHVCARSGLVDKACIFSHAVEYATSICKKSCRCVKLSH